jgi:hypothetical protein
MTDVEFVGACGKKLKGYCVPEIEDDLCATCSFNIYNDQDAMIDIGRAILDEEKDYDYYEDEDE